MTTTRTPPVVTCEECGRSFGSDPSGDKLCGPCTKRLLAAATRGKCLARELVTSKNGNYYVSCQNSVSGPGRVTCAKHLEEFQRRTR